LTDYLNICFHDEDQLNRFKLPSDHPLSTLWKKLTIRQRRAVMKTERRKRFPVSMKLLAGMRYDSEKNLLTSLGPHKHVIMKQKISNNLSQRTSIKAGSSSLKVIASCEPGFSTRKRSLAEAVMNMNFQKKAKVDKVQSLPHSVGSKGKKVPMQTIKNTIKAFTSRISGPSFEKLESDRVQKYELNKKGPPARACSPTNIEEEEEEIIRPTMPSRLRLKSDSESSNCDEVVPGPYEYLTKTTEHTDDDRTDVEIVFETGVGKGAKTQAFAVKLERSTATNEETVIKLTADVIHEPINVPTIEFNRLETSSTNNNPKGTGDVNIHNIGPTTPTFKGNSISHVNLLRENIAFNDVSTTIFEPSACHASTKDLISVPSPHESNEQNLLQASEHHNFSENTADGETDPACILPTFPSVVPPTESSSSITTGNTLLNNTSHNEQVILNVNSTAAHTVDPIPCSSKTINACSTSSFICSGKLFSSYRPYNFNLWNLRSPESEPDTATRKSVGMHVTGEREVEFPSLNQIKNQQKWFRGMHDYEMVGTKMVVVDKFGQKGDIAEIYLYETQGEFKGQCTRFNLPEFQSLIASHTNILHKGVHLVLESSVSN
jgi:hypothetical protein